MPSEELPQEEMQEGITMDDVLSIVESLWQKRKIIAAVVGVATLLSIVISLLLRNTFQSTVVLLPETDKSKLSSLGGLSDLASLAGVNVGGEGSLLKLYPTILTSESVLKNVIYKKYVTKEFPQPVNLIEYWEIEAKSPELSYEMALQSLRDELHVSMDNKTSVITMSLSTHEPQLSADILNTVTSELDEFIRSKRTTSAGEQRKFVEARMKEVKDDLTASENNLKDFREKNRQVLSPQLLLEQERLIRDVQINATVYTELRKQFELAKIEEVKNIPVINVMDTARPAAKKDKPKRSVIVITVFLLSFIGTAGYFIIGKIYGPTLQPLNSRLRNIFRT